MAVIYIEMQLLAAISHSVHVVHAFHDFVLCRVLDFDEFLIFNAANEANLSNGNTNDECATLIHWLIHPLLFLFTFWKKK